MKKLMSVLLLGSAITVWVNAETIVKSILETALDAQNQGLIAGVAIQLDTVMDDSYELPETIMISNPSRNLSDMEDDMDLAVSFGDAAIVGNALLLRQRQSGIVFHIDLDLILLAFPIIPDSSAYQRFIRILQNRN